MKIRRIVARIPRAATVLLPLVIACGGETLVIGEDDAGSGSHPGSQSGNQGSDAYEAGVSYTDGGPDQVGSYDAGPYPDFDAWAGDDSTVGQDPDAYAYADSTDPYDVWNYDAADWPSPAALGCTTSGDDCSCSASVGGHSYSYRCSDYTATCNCMIDGTLEATVLGSTVCGPSDAATSPLLTTWFVLCDFPQ